MLRDRFDCQPVAVLNGGRELSEYREIIVQDVAVGPVGPVRKLPVVATRIDSVVNERRRMSGVAVAALVVAAITVAVVITMLITNDQQQTRDDQLAHERAGTAAAQPAPAQPAPQQPLIVTLPASQPAAAVPSPAARPVRPPPSYTDSAPSNAALEIDVTSLLQNDEKLRTYAVEVKITDGTAVLSGNVSDEDLKKRAGMLAGKVHGIKRVINNIAVRP